MTHAHGEQDVRNLRTPPSIRFRLEIKTTNALNAGFGSSRIAQASIKRRQREAAHGETVRLLEAAGVEIRQKAIPERVVRFKAVERKGVIKPASVKVIPARELRVVVLPGVVWAAEVWRIAPGELDDHDGLPAALKGIVDGLADALDVDDGDRSVFARPRYLQRKEGRGVYAVEVWLRATEVAK